MNQNFPIYQGPTIGQNRDRSLAPKGPGSYLGGDGQRYNFPKDRPDFGDLGGMTEEWRGWLSLAGNDPNRAAELWMNRLSKEEEDYLGRGAMSPRNRQIIAALSSFVGKNPPIGSYPQPPVMEPLTQTGPRPQKPGGVSGGGRITPGSLGIPSVSVSYPGRGSNVPGYWVETPHMRPKNIEQAFSNALAGVLSGGSAPGTKQELIAALYSWVDNKIKSYPRTESGGIRADFMFQNYEALMYWLQKLLTSQANMPPAWS